MIVSPEYTGKEWISWSKEHSFSMCTYNMKDSSEYVEACTQVIRKDTSLRNLLGESICDKADAIIITWNESMTELDGATWELMRLAYDRKVPCVWISTKTQNMYCLWESYYKSYYPGYLETASEPLSDKEIQPEVSAVKKEKFLSFWKKCRSNFLNKFKAGTSVHPAEEDLLLKEGYQMETLEGEAVRQILLHKFEQFDAAAIDSSTKFQAMMYQRSVLPFIATVFIAIGFYVETLIGTTTSLLIPAWEAPITIFALIVAGLGFLIHGALNLYTYRLSKNQEIQKWQQDYTDNRYIAELLRILIHFVPYGVSLNIRKLCGSNQKLYTYIKHLADEAEPQEQNLSKQNVAYVL